MVPLISRDTSPTFREFFEVRGTNCKPTRYFFGRTESFMALPTRNFNVVLAGI